MDTIKESAKINHMVINGAKCSTIRIAVNNQDPIPITVDNINIPHMPSMKLLGVTIQNNLKWEEQVKCMVSKANTRKYFISVLRHAGVQMSDLIKCYCTFIRPILEYASPVWHSGLTCHQSDMLERIQMQVLRTVLPDSSYREALIISGLLTLKERRQKLCLNFAQGLLESEFSCWLPPRRGACHQRDLRNNDKLSSLTARTKRFSASPIMNCVTLLNM